MIYHSFNFNFLGYSIPFLHSLHMFQSFCRHERVKPCVEVSTKSKGAISNIRCIFAWRKEMYPNNQLHYLQMDLTQLWCYLHHKLCRSFPLHVDWTKSPPPICTAFAAEKTCERVPFVDLVLSHLLRFL